MVLIIDILLLIEIKVIVNEMCYKIVLKWFVIVFIFKVIFYLTLLLLKRLYIDKKFFKGLVFIY